MHMYLQSQEAVKTIYLYGVDTYLYILVVAWAIASFICVLAWGLVPKPNKGLIR